MGNVKGTNVLQVVRMLRASREASLGKLPARLHRYLDERILPSSWYPEKDQLGLLRALAEILPSDGGDRWMMLGCLAAQVDLGSTYRALLHPADPARTIGHSGVVWRNFHDTGSMTIADDGPNAVLLTVRDYVLRSPEMCRLIGGYAMGTVLTAGAKDVQVVKRECTSLGRAQCVWRVSWS